MDYAEAKPFAFSGLQGLETGPSELATRMATCVRLDWEDLQCFEVVNRQFESWGVTFANAIALRPSNPAYPTYSGVMVLMGAPRNGWLEITFLRPVRFVSGFITSSRRTIVTAFDGNNQPVAKVETAGANLAGSKLAAAPNMQLSLNGSDIHRVVFRAFDGQFTLDTLCFSF